MTIRLGAVIFMLCAAVPTGAAALGSLSGLSFANNSNDGTASGCCPSCAQTKTTLGVVSQTQAAFTTRFAQIITADARLTTPISIGLNSNYTISFDAICPIGAYRLNVTTRARGAFTHVDDSLGCGVAGTAQSDLSPISGLQSGGTLQGSLSLPDPGGAGPTSSAVYQPFDISEPATILGMSSGAPVGHTFVFSWTISCASNATAFTCGQECAVRMGLAADSPLDCPTDNISADDYPGVGSRVAADDGHFVTVELECLCGNGAVDPGEECDEGSSNGSSTSCCSATCELVPQNVVCRPSASACDVAESCDGVGGSCPSDVFAPPNAPCPDDGNDCTDDVCDGAGTCTHPNKPPGAPCGGGTGACDGAGSCGPPPSPTATPTPVPLCAATPRAGCRTPALPQKSSLLVQNLDGTLKDKLVWKWNRGAATTTADFGNPQASTSYALCIYDEAGGVPALVASVHAPAGGLCANSRPCWTALGTKGFRYQNALLTPDGMHRLLLREGSNGKARVQAIAKGPFLALPAPVNGKVLRQDPRVIVQLVNDAPAPLCWETRFSQPATRNTLVQFKDKSD